MAKRTTPRPEARRSRGGTPAVPVPESAADAVTSESAAAVEPSEEDIRLRAYHRYLQRGGGHGMDFEDWLEAERELKARQ